MINKEYWIKFKINLLNKFNLSTLNKNLYFNALTHKSFFQNNNNLQIQDYEKLEFFGDSIINFVISEFLFKKYNSEELMSNFKKQIVQSKSLVFCAKKINLEQFIQIGKSIDKNNMPDSIIEDCFESFVAAIYINNGIEITKNFLNQTLWTNFLNNELIFSTDYKTILQEESYKKYKLNVEYKNKKITLNNKSSFLATCSIGNLISETACCTKIKEAEKKCAKLVLDKFFSC